MRRLALALSSALLAAAFAAPALAVDGTGVSLQGMDKITARIFAFEAPLNETVRFGSLEITARKCVVSDSGQEVPEKTAFLEIVERKPGKDPERLFSGWMFASTPSVSALENPIYDIWVVGCTGVPTDSVETTTSQPSQPDEVAPPVEGAERPLD